MKYSIPFHFIHNHVMNCCDVTNPPSRFSNYNILHLPKLGGRGYEELLAKSLDSEGLANLANAGRLVLELRLNHPTANLTLLQGMTGSTLLIENLFISIKSCFLILFIIFFSAIGDNIPTSLSLPIDDCNTVSTAQ